MSVVTIITEVMFWTMVAGAVGLLATYAAIALVVAVQTLRGTTDHFTDTDGNSPLKDQKTEATTMRGRYTTVTTRRLFGVPYLTDVYEDGKLVGAIVQGRFYRTPVVREATESP